MNPSTPLHPAMVHLPIGLAAAVPFLVFAALMLLKRDRSQTSIWWLVVLVQFLLVLSAFIAMRTGESDEESVKNVVTEHDIEEHEEMAKAFFLVGLATFAMMLGAIKDFAATRYIRLASLVLSVVVLALALLTGKRGGELVFEKGAASAFSKRQSPATLDKAATPTER